MESQPDWGKIAPQPLGGLQGESGPRRDPGEKTLAELVSQYDVHPNQITQWKAQLQARAADVFGGVSPPDTPPVDLKVLRAKIGELALENDFLEHALIKADMLSAKR